MEEKKAIDNIMTWYLEQSKRHSILSYLRKHNASQTLQKWYNVNWKRIFIFHYLQKQASTSESQQWLKYDNESFENSIFQNQNCECSEFSIPTSTFQYQLKQEEELLDLNNINIDRKNSDILENFEETLPYPEKFDQNSHERIQDDTKTRETKFSIDNSSSIDDKDKTWQNQFAIREADYDDSYDISTKQQNETSSSMLQNNFKNKEVQFKIDERPFIENSSKKVTLEEAISSYVENNRNSENLQHWCGNSEKRNYVIKKLIQYLAVITISEWYKSNRNNLPKKERHALIADALIIFLKRNQAPEILQNWCKVNEWKRKYVLEQVKTYLAIAMIENWYSKQYTLNKEYENKIKSSTLSDSFQEETIESGSEFRDKSQYKSTTIESYEKSSDLSKKQPVKTKKRLNIRCCNVQ